MRPNRQPEACPKRSWRSFGRPHETGGRECRPSDNERRHPARANDAALIAAISARNADAIEEAYDRYADRLYLLAMLVSDDQQRAQSAVGDALLALWKDPVALHADTRGVHAALAGESYARATAQPAGSLRRRSRPRTIGPQTDTHSPLACLPRPQRDLLALIVLGDHTRRQAADRVGVPDDDAVSLISSALHSLYTHRATHDLALTPDQLQDALSNRVVIEHAKGILAQHGQINTSTALVLLRARADKEHARLSDIARDVVDGHVDVATLVDPRPATTAQQRSAPGLHER